MQRQLNKPGRFTGGGSVPSMIQIMIAVKKKPQNAQVYRNYLMVS